jgi:sodium transport system permease protein
VFWNDVATIYVRELRGALRERMIVVNALVLPVILYPGVLWLVFSAVGFVQGVGERVETRVALGPPVGGHESLRDSLAAAPGVIVVAAPADPEAAVADDAIDAYVAFEPAPSDGVRTRVRFDGTRDGGRRAQARVQAVVERYGAALLAARAAGAAVDPDTLGGFNVVRTDVATGSQRGASQLAEIVPLLLVVMVAFGCFVPAIDVTAGERERATWETTMTLAASRGAILTGKYLFVATMGAVAGTLNVAAIGLTLAPLFNMLLGQEVASTFALPPRGIPLILLGTTLLALFFAAAMMIMASFARTFKDGQSMITPVYWLVLVPLLFAASPDQSLTPTLALVPIANVTLMTADAIRGTIALPLVGLVVAVELATILLCIRLARSILAFEDLLLGSFAGSFWRFARERLRSGRAAAR